MDPDATDRRKVLQDTDLEIERAMKASLQSLRWQLASDCLLLFIISIIITLNSRRHPSHLAFKAEPVVIFYLWVLVFTFFPATPTISTLHTVIHFRL